MATVFSEDWSAGNSLFSSMAEYDREVALDPEDPLYPFMWGSYYTYINGDGMLDFNPAHSDPPDTNYDAAGVWIKGFGPEAGGYFDANQGCMQAAYYPSEDSINGPDAAQFECALITLADEDGFPHLGVSVDLNSNVIVMYLPTVSTHDSIVTVVGAPMPVVGEPYAVRLGWQCGSIDPDTDAVNPDGFVRLWINGELTYEAVDADLNLDQSFTPVDPPNMIDSLLIGYYGLLGPLDSITVSDSACAVDSQLLFESGRTSSPLVWSEILLKEIE